MTREDGRISHALRDPICLWALATGAAVRVSMALLANYRTDIGDAATYWQLAANLADSGVFSEDVKPPLCPSLNRTPGYPLFLVPSYLLLGTPRIAFLAQALLEALTIPMGYVLALSASKRAGTARIASWMLALCPFSVAYVPVAMTESLSASLAVFVLFCSWRAVGRHSHVLGLLSGLLLGALILVRPDFALYCLPLGGWLAVEDYLRSRRTYGTPILLVGLTLVLLPWVLRNAFLFGRFEPLANRYPTRYAQSASDQPWGFYAWVRTWNRDPRDAFGSIFPYFGGHWCTMQFPDHAFDSIQERDQVGQLISRMCESGHDLEVRMQVEQAFARLAKARTRDEPLRSYLILPARRSARIWIASRGWNLPFFENRAQRLVLLGLNAAFLLLGICGVVLVSRSSLVWLIASVPAYRVILFAFWGGVEVRYAMPGFPPLIILAAIGAGEIHRRWRKS